MDNRKLLGIEMGRISAAEYHELEPRGLVVVLDNVRSAHNVGSAFRSCDAFRADELILCGICATPPSPEIHKTALGAEDSVPSRYFSNTLDAVRSLKSQGYTVLAVEQTVSSVALDAFIPQPDKKYALVMGNEVEGVGQDVVDECDGALEIPQWGTKHSLNVSVALGIILWHFRPGDSK